MKDEGCNNNQSVRVRFIPSPSSFGLSSCVLWCCGQNNRKRRAAPLFGAHADRASMIIDCLFDNGKSQPGASFFRRIIRLEDLGNILSSYTSSRISNLDAYSVDCFGRQLNPNVPPAAIYRLETID